MGILIRRYQQDDADRLLEAAEESVEQVFPWMPWCHRGYSIAESRAWIAHCEATWVLEIVVALDNVASHGVAEKVGALREGVAHDRRHLHDRPHDAIVYALLRSRHRPGSG